MKIILFLFNSFAVFLSIYSSMVIAHPTTMISAHTAPSFLIHWQFVLGFIAAFVVIKLLFFAKSRFPLFFSCTLFNLFVLILGFSLYYYQNPQFIIINLFLIMLIALPIYFRLLALTLYKVPRYLAGGTIILVILSLLKTPWLTLDVTLIYILLLHLFFLFLALKQWQQHRPNSFLFCFTIIWIILFSTLWLSIEWQLLRLGSQQIIWVTVGVVILMLLLTSTIFNLFFFTRDQQLLQQQEQLLNTQMTQKIQQEQLKAQQEAQEVLEAKIQERTFELEVTLREMEGINRELAEKNTHDELTKIYNRGYFDKKYLAEFRRSRREQSTLGILMLDIDYFKQVNDNYGHLVGDEVIRRCAESIQQQLKRSSDVVCRYGGEEFIVIMPATTAEGLIFVAENIRHSIEQTTISLSNVSLNITISIGAFADIIQEGMDKDYPIASADQALYQAKTAGRDQVKLYQSL